MGLEEGSHEWLLNKLTAARTFNRISESQRRAVAKSTSSRVVGCFARFAGEDQRRRTQKLAEAGLKGLGAPKEAKLEMLRRNRLA